MKKNNIYTRLKVLLINKIIDMLRFYILLSLFSFCNGEKVILENNNHIHLKGEINPKSSSEFITEINKITSDKVYIYIYNPQVVMLNLVKKL